MHPVLQGILAGYGIAIPVGAIAILIVETAIRRGFRGGFAAGCGAASADLAYSLLAAIAGQTLMKFLAPNAVYLRYISIIVLVLIGVRGLLQIRLSASPSKPVDQQLAVETEPVDAWPIYLRFTGLTLLNPLTITYFGAIILGGSADIGGWGGKMFFVLGAALASLSWQTLLAMVGAFFRRRLSPSSQKLVSIVGNFIVIALGIRMAFI
jgi:threonine/homoserine/homoserine lactone efflux protein